MGSDYTLSTSGNYASNKLSVLKITDEDQRVSYTFTDKLGRMVLSREMNGNETHDTYYVYDDHSNLCFVLQPIYQDSINLAKFAFQYRYDHRNRCVYKKVPGAGYIEYTYDTADRLTFSQDGVQRAAGKYTFYEYDNLSRVTCQGECTGKNANTNRVVHIQNYYDSYGFIDSTGFTDNLFTSDNTGYGRGKLTGSVLTVLGTASKVYTAYYYDAKGRETKSVRSNLLGGYDVKVTTYTFSSQPATVTITHTASGKTTQTEVYTYTYDYADRVSKVKHSLNGTQVTLADYTYDAYGRQATQMFHGNSSNKLTYAYNLRSWLTGISGSKLTQNLYYNTGNGTAQYGGNISSMTWKAGSETTTRGYKFTYDGLSRMLNATYGEGTAISTNANRFSENVTAYDKNGNIKTLLRYGQTAASTYGLVDNLTYILTGNLLNRVDDATTATAYGTATAFSNGANAAGEYAYDANGNLTKDLNKGISNIQYNVLNLPGVVTFSDGSTITYSYAADGSKLRTVHVVSGTTTQTDYCGNVIYEGGAQKYLLTQVGYVDLNGAKQYHYYLKDHQGNVRVVMNQNGTTVEETNHYYPFGGLFASANVQPFKYNGKELDMKKSLNWYDYGARHYDPVLGRFATQDPLAEKYYQMGVYLYCGNNPILFIDKNGLDFGPGDLFQTKRDAAKDWGMYYNGVSIVRKREMSSLIFEVRIDGEAKGYSYTEAIVGEAHKAKISVPLNSNKIKGTIHSHGSYDAPFIGKDGKKNQYKDNVFSGADKGISDMLKIKGYLATPNGSLLEYDPRTKNEILISTDLPSDSKDPTRQNSVPAVDSLPKSEPSLMDKLFDTIKHLFE